MNFMNRSDQLLKTSIIIKKLFTRTMFLSIYMTALSIIISTSSCSLLSDNIRTSRISDENSKKLIQEIGIYINSITVYKSFDSETVRTNASFVFKILTGKKGLETEAILKEDSFVKGFQQLNTVSLELIIKDRNGKPLKFILISEESNNTLSSYNYLYKILEKGIKETGL